MGKLVAATVLGGVVVFVWGMASWILLPWHESTRHAFTNERAVSAVIAVSVSAAGVYVLPDPSKHDRDALRQGPVVLAAIRPAGVNPASPGLYLGGLLVDMTGALLMSCLLLLLPGLGYWARVRIVTLVALTGGILGHLPDWHWWGFSGGYTAVAIADLVIAYFLAGLVIAKVLGAARPSSRG